MYALLGKDQVKIIESSKGKVIKNFSKEVLNLNGSEIIVDYSDIFEFYLDELPNSTFWDAQNYLACQRKAFSVFEVSFLVPEKLFFQKFWQRKNYYIQKISCTNFEFFKNLNLENGIIPIELIILDFCKKIEKITKNIWWFYIAEHELSGVRIVAGCGNGIILSRSLDMKFLKSENLSKEVIDSLRFLRRFGLENDFKIITTLHEIKLGNQKINPINLEAVCRNLKLNNAKDIEECLLNFFSAYKTRSVIFSKTSSLKYFFNKNREKIIKLLKMTIVFLFFYLCCIGFKIKNLQNEIEDYKKQNNMILTDGGKNIELSVTNENFSFIFQFIEHLRNLKNPARFLEKIASFLDEQKLKSNYVEIENLSSIQLRTKLNEEQKGNLGKNENFKIDFKELQNFSNEEYEELKSKSEKKEDEVMICIKIK